MKTDAQWSGVAILCSQTGVVHQLLRDDLDIQIQEGVSVVSLFDSGSTTKARMFLAEIRARRATFGWELNIPISEHVSTLQFGGGLVDGRILIVGAVSTAGVSVHFYEELMRIKNEQMNALRSAVKEQNLKERLAGDANLFTDLTELNNELINLQRELAKKNAELTTQREQLAIANEKLHVHRVALEQSRRKYADLYDFAPIGYFTLDEKGRIVQANLTGAALLGFDSMDRDTLIKQPFIYFVAKAYKETFIQHHRASCRPGAPESCEVQLAGQDDSPFWARLQSVAVNEREVSTRLIRTVVSDITERKRAEDALRRSEARVRTIIEGNADAMIVIDAYGIIAFTNPAVETLFGNSNDTLLGRPFGFPLTGGEQEEIEILRPDGSVAIAEMSAVEIEWESKTAHLASLRDVTARKQAEAERERLIAELDAFAHTVAHDLKNPLNATIGFAEILLDELDTLQKDEIKHHLETIVRSGFKMRDIINALLLLAGVRRREDVDIAPLDMAQIAQEAKARLAPMAQEAQAEIIQPPAEAWPAAAGYAPWVEEVWVNYLSNAIKYGGPAPRIELGAEAVSDGMICFWVRDDGPGIAPEDQDRLFLPFTRIGQAHIDGHGLGLSIVERIIQKLGGQVGVKSAPGEGSRFYFTLPAHRQADH